MPKPDDKLTEAPPAAPAMKDVIARSHIHTGKGAAPFKPGTTVKLAKADAEHLVAAGLASWPKDADVDPALARTEGPAVLAGNAALAAEPGR